MSDVSRPFVWKAGDRWEVEIGAGELAVDIVESGFVRPVHKQTVDRFRKS